MKILILNGSPHLQNMGDLAMLQVMVRRLQQLCQPEIWIDTEVSQPLLKKYFKPPVINCSLPKAIRLQKSKTNRLTRLFTPSLTKDSIEMLNEVDLILLSGGGYLGVDAFRDHSDFILDCLLLTDKPIGIMGHGFGISRDYSFNAKLKKVLHKVKMVAIREKLTSLPLLRKLEVEERKIKITGDDAIELARQPIPSNRYAIGLNIRNSSYSNIGGNFKEVVYNIIKATTQNPIISIPISLVEKESDELEGLSLGLDKYLIKGPEDVVDKISTCKLVITCSYHAAVFALTQNIPVIGLVASEYYQQKFNGLKDMFLNTDMCNILNVDDNIKTNLKSSLLSLLNRNDYYTDNNALAQINAGWQAYSDIITVCN